MEYSSADAIRKLFKVDVAKKELAAFRNSIITLEGKDDATRILDYERCNPEPGKRNSKRVYRDEHLPWLHNVIIIQGFFPKPQRIKDILSCSGDMRDSLLSIRDAIGKRVNLGRIQFNDTQLTSFFQAVGSGMDCKKDKLPNPFKSLPQLHGLSVIGALNHEAGYMAGMCDMLGAYWQQDIELAYQLASELRQKHNLDSLPELAKAVSMVEGKYKEAIDFRRLLDFFN